MRTATPTATGVPAYRSLHQLHPLLADPVDGAGDVNHLLSLQLLQDTVNGDESTCATNASTTAGRKQLYDNVSGPTNCSGAPPTIECSPTHYRAEPHPLEDAALPTCSEPGVVHGRGCAVK